MMSKRSNLILLLLIAGAVSIAYKMGESYLFYPAIIFGGFALIYAYFIKCPYCHKKQVFRGFSILDIKLPKSNCHYCGSPLNKKDKIE